MILVETLTSITNYSFKTSYKSKLSFNLPTSVPLVEEQFKGFWIVPTILDQN